MLISYDDITDKLGEPLWYTERGYPRYCAFSPDECGIYHYAAALLEIACQQCAKRFRIGIPWSPTDISNVRKILADAGRRVEDLIITGRDERWQPIYRGDDETVTVAALRAALETDNINSTLRRPAIGDAGSFGFGDPPNHGCIGDTMGSWEIQIIEYWERQRTDGYVGSDGRIDSKRYAEDRGRDIHDWARYPEHEVEIGDQDGNVARG